MIAYLFLTIAFVSILVVAIILLVWKIDAEIAWILTAAFGVVYLVWLMVSVNVNKPLFYFVGQQQIQEALSE